MRLVLPRTSFIDIKHNLIKKCESGICTLTKYSGHCTTGSWRKHFPEQKPTRDALSNMSWQIQTQLITTTLLTTIHMIILYKNVNV
jgi:hypothetical protein